jgi:hypothetical protein
MVWLSENKKSWLKQTLSQRFNIWRSQNKNISNLKVQKKKNDVIDFHNQKKNILEPLCYASLAYNTKTSSLIRSQQFTKNARTSFFYNRILKGGRTSHKFNSLFF